MGISVHCVVYEGESISRFICHSGAVPRPANHTFPFPDWFSSSSVFINFSLFLRGWISSNNPGCAIRDVLLEDVAQRNIPLSHKKLRRALKAITRSESYLCAMKAGACRYDTEGYVTEHISQEEEAYAAERLEKIRRQNRIKAELQAVLNEK